MAANPRRFRLWPLQNMTGVARQAAFAEGVLFTDGTVAVRFAGAAPACVVYPTGGMEALRLGRGFGGPAQIEWMDGAHG